MTDLSTTTRNPVIPRSALLTKSPVGAKTVADVDKVQPRGQRDDLRAPRARLQDERRASSGLSCVDRRGIAGASSRKLSDGDIPVVRTTQFSWWMAR